MPSRRPFFLLVAGAALVHASAIAWVQIRSGRIDAYAFNSLDCGEYFSIARNIVQHAAFSQDSSPPLTPDTWRTPGYPLLLAGAMLFTGDSPTALVVLQHFLAAASALIFFFLLGHFVSPGKALLGSVLFLIEPYHLLYASWLLNTTLFTFVLLIMWWLLERARQNPSLWLNTVVGLLAGFLVLIWPGAILLPLFTALAVFLLRYTNEVPPQHDITTPIYPRIAVLIVILGGLAPPLAWMARNSLVAGHFALSHQSGIVLAYFKATEVELWRQGRTKDRYLETSLNPEKRELQHTVWDEIDQALCARMMRLQNPVPYYPLYAENKPFVFAMRECKELKWENLAQGNKTHWDSFQISGALRSIGLHMLTHSPPATIGCGLTRIVENLTFPLNLAIQPAEGASINQMKAAAVGSAYTLLVGAAGIGLFRARKNWTALYFPIACVIALALTTAPQIDPRFRVPMIPCLIFLAIVPSRRAES